MKSILILCGSVLVGLPSSGLAQAPDIDWAVSVSQIKEVYGDPDSVDMRTYPRHPSEHFLVYRLDDQVLVLAVGGRTGGLFNVRWGPDPGGAIRDGDLHMLMPRGADTDPYWYEPRRMGAWWWYTASSVGDGPEDLQKLFRELRERS